MPLLKFAHRLGMGQTSPKFLNRFWFLQDSLFRLIEAVHNESGGVTQCRSIIRKVVNLLESQKVQKLSSIPGVKFSCEIINSYLISLEELGRIPNSEERTQDFGAV
jgi:hypothetical protein